MAVMRISQGVRTPQVVLLIGGDAGAFEYVAHALDESDPATGAAVPVLVIKESGGAALDMYNYVFGSAEAPTSWPPPNEEDDPSTARLLPDAKKVDPGYYAKAKEWLPKILRHGNKTGGNTTRQLAFYRIDDGSGEAVDLATTIQKAMLNDCPDARQEALLAVKWGEPTILKGKLEEMGLAAAAGGAEDGDSSRSRLGYEEGLQFDERLKVRARVCTCLVVAHPERGPSPPRPTHCPRPQRPSKSPSIMDPSPPPPYPPHPLHRSTTSSSSRCKRPSEGFSRASWWRERRRSRRRCYSSPSSVGTRS